LGLQLMRYRTGLIGGSFQISNDAVNGTKISCTISHLAPDTSDFSAAA